MILFVLNIQNRQIHKKTSRFVVARSWGAGEVNSDCLMEMGFLSGVVRIFWN